jgi:hypothetical protein
MRTIRQQTGMTALATIFIIILVAFIAFLALRLIPVYLEYFNVVSSVNSLQEVPDLSQKGEATIRELLKRRFEINDIKRVTFDNVKITRSGSKIIVAVTYEARVNVLSNIDLIVSFHKQSEFP